jgi:hypothetical protein
MSNLRPILKPILAATMPVYAATSAMLISIVVAIEIAGSIASYYPQYALSALALLFLPLEIMGLYTVASRRSDSNRAWDNARVQIPLHWRKAILDVIGWVRNSALVQLTLFYAAIGIMWAITWGTMQILKAIDASALVDLIAALLWSFVGIFLFSTGLVLYRSALAPVDMVQGEALDDIIDALPKIGPRGVESMKRSISLSYSPKHMSVLTGFMTLACVGSGVAAMAPFLGFPLLAAPALDLSALGICLFVATSLVPLISRKKSSLMRALSPH